MRKPRKECVEDVEKITIFGYPKKLEKRMEFDLLFHKDGSFLHVPLRDKTTMKETRRVEILLDTQACHFGDQRYWFCCPTCKRSVGFLYVCKIGFLDTLACRKCADLTYKDRQEKGSKYFEVDRLQRKQQKVLEKMGKKRIWARTYMKYYEQFEALNRQIALQIGVEQRDIMRRDLDKFSSVYSLAEPRKEQENL